MKFEPTTDGAPGVSKLLLTAESEDERGKLAQLIYLLESSGGNFFFTEVVVA
jgi:hypothetical protein